MRVMEQLRQAQDSESDDDSLYNQNGEIEVYGRQRALQKKRSLITDKLQGNEKKVERQIKDEHQTYITDVSKAEDLNFDKN